ncbi:MULTISPECIES: EAL domain-containing protein [unclassified Thermosynechococcus]|uniref:sensor domain-containing protein n=1 Tax=unclassified Thermosynechococcus TaxID=2622553 RepID=UPI002672C980|nr:MULTISPECIES: EAL domain-containing protein [unclassified Thermosynechococcus]WKT84943.1 EAL domain-containing protein [Thermosynechococcus sp. HY596]WNC64077.1 EAL domain-containing protein [Thermosynechococcus sp. HY591]WNC66644.1 EAL domain-containing protein [Thermosynechococcus sp. HY593]
MTNPQFLRVVALLSLGVATAVFIEWVLAAITSHSPLLVGIDVFAAIALGLTALAITLMGSRGRDRELACLPQLCGLVLVLMGVAIAVAVFNAQEITAPWQALSLPAYTSLLRPVAFIGLGVALWGVRGERSWQVIFGQGGAITSACLLFLEVLAGLYQLPLSLSASALGQILACVLLGLLNLCLMQWHPSRGVMRYFSSQRIGGLLLRRLLPWSILGPLLIGWVIQWVHHDRLWLSERLAQEVQIISIIAFLVTLLVTEAQHLNQVEQERQSFWRAYTEMDEVFRNSLLLSPLPMALVAADGQLWLMNRAWQEQTGSSPEETPTWEGWLAIAFPEAAQRQWAATEFQRCLITQARVEHGDVCIRTRAKQERIWQMVSLPLQLPNGNQQFILLTAVDVTRQRQLTQQLAAQQTELEAQVIARTLDLHNVNGELQAAQEKLNQLLDRADAFVSEIRLFPDGSWCYEYLSQGHLRILGYSPLDFQEDPNLWRSRVPSEDWEAYHRPFREKLLQEGCAHTEYRFQHRDGHEVWISLNATAEPQGDGSYLITTVGVDVTQRKKAMLALVESETRFRQMADASPLMIWLADSKGTIEFANQTICRVLGASLDQILGWNWLDLVHPEDRERTEQAIRLAVEQQQSYEIEHRLRNGQGVYRWVLKQAAPRYAEDGTCIGYLGSCLDITNIKLAEEKLRQLACQDSLTNLPNRAFLTEKIDQLLAAYHRGDIPPFAVLFLDLDRFKVINDSLGHDAGDELLLEIAHRLRSSMRQQEIVGRLGGDEFIAILEHIEGLQQIYEYGDRLRHCISEPYVLKGTEVSVSVSIGIAIVNSRYRTAGELLRDADIAMYAAKAQGCNGMQLFESEHHQAVYTRLQREQEFRRALEQEQLALFYQPIVSLSQDSLVGFEVLVRWQHPENGWISPAEFLPLALGLGLATKLDQWVLQKAIFNLYQWQQTLGSRAADFTLSVNISSAFFNSGQMVPLLKHLLPLYGIRGQQVILEITEEVIMPDSRFAQEQLEALQALDIRCGIDDFGTGYSSLSRLSQLPLYALKIDQSFVRDIETNFQNLEIVRAIISLARTLQLEVVAEGIEHLSQKQCLQALGCQRGQGFLFGEPLSEEQAHQLLQARITPCQTESK